MTTPASPEDVFPGLRGTSYWVTSCATLRPPWYNCVAWALGDDTQWWEAGRLDPNCHWPHGVLDDGTLAAYLQLFRSRGYVDCQGEALEPGHEKIAIYELAGQFKHVAYQRDDGVWLSKLGFSFDIEHASLTALAGPRYGTPNTIMRRPWRSTRACPQ